MRLEELKREDIPAVLRIADSTVGKNLYSSDDFLSSLCDEDKFVYVLKDGERCAGYIYFLLTSSCGLEASLGLKAGTLSFSSLTGRIQSVALDGEYRGMGLASKMMKAAVAALVEKGAGIVYIVCWKPGGFLPLANALGECGFDYLMTVKEAWYGDEDLYCPHCRGRCHCDADVYYKKLSKEKI